MQGAVDMTRTELERERREERSLVVASSELLLVALASGLPNLHRRWHEAAGRHSCWQTGAASAKAEAGNADIL